MYYDDKETESITSTVIYSPRPITGARASSDHIWRPERRDKPDVDGATAADVT